MSLSLSAQDGYLGSSIAAEEIPVMYRYLGKSAVGGGLGYIASSLMYPQASFTWGNTSIQRSTFVAAAMFFGFMVNEFAQDKLLPHIARDARLTHFTSIGTSVGTVAAIDYAAHILMDPKVAKDLEIKKVLLESAGAVVLTEYLYEHVLLPFFGYNLANK